MDDLDFNPGHKYVKDHAKLIQKYLTDMPHDDQPSVMTVIAVHALWIFHLLKHVEDEVFEDAEGESTS